MYIVMFERCVQQDTTQLLLLIPLKESQAYVIFRSVYVLVGIGSWCSFPLPSIGRQLHMPQGIQ